MAVAFRQLSRLPEPQIQAAAVAVVVLKVRF
jgi:hypothetical protein